MILLSATQALKYASLSRLADYQLGEKLAELSTPQSGSLCCALPEHLKQVKHLGMLSWDLLCVISLLVNTMKRQNKSPGGLWAVSWAWASSEPCHQQQPTATWAVYSGQSIPGRYTLSRRDFRKNWSEFSGEHQHAQEAGALVLRGWGIWACAGWSREGLGGTRQQPWKTCTEVT